MVKVSVLGFGGERSNAALPIKSDRCVCVRFGGWQVLRSLVNSHAGRVNKLALFCYT